MDLEDLDLDALESTMGCKEIPKGIPLLDALVTVGLVNSRADGKRAMGKNKKAGPSMVRLNNFHNAAIDELDFLLDTDVCPDGKHVFLFVGKKVKMVKLVG